MSSHPPTRARWYWGAALILMGALLLLHQLDIMDIGDVFSNYWPLILVFIGIKMILFPAPPKETATTVTPLTETSWKGPAGTSMASDYISENRFIGDVTLRMESENFQSGTVSTFIGDLNLDLSGIRMSGGDRYLTISGFIGDAMIKMPPALAYSIHANALIGDFKVFGKRDGGFGLNKIYKSPDFDQAPARLNVRISFFIGDVSIQ